MEILETIVEKWLWGPALTVSILVVGLLLTLGSGLFQFRHFFYMLRRSWSQIFARGDRPEKRLSAFEALSVATGSTVGVGNIAGVASAIAWGGPGAVFWMWVAGFLGQVIKMAEVSLAVHYRTHDEGGKTFGGPTYYIREAIGRKMNRKGLYKILNALFLGGFFVSFLFTMQTYTVSEAIAGTFQWNQIVVAVIYTVLTYLMISGGLKGLARIAVILVPFMCVFFLLGGLVIIFRNISALPGALGLIFDGAFNGTAAVGGFGGAAFARVVKVGMSRAVYSNEAGWGTSPMIHASARTDHPIRQGVLGIFEVFVDTIVVCSITALTILVTGKWTTGLSGATLTLEAFRSEWGMVGHIVLTAGIFLFGITTSTGFYAQIEVLVRYVSEKRKFKERILTLYKWAYPLPPLLLVIVSVGYGLPTTHVWLFADIGTAMPIFVNILALAVLCPDFFKLLADYKARYMGIGSVDPDFKVFYNEPSQ